MADPLPANNAHKGKQNAVGVVDASAPPAERIANISADAGPRALTKESTWWDTYNKEANKMDEERIKDWRDSLSNLLIFAAIFAAVLTAFIIESKKLLEEDSNAAMLEVMIFYTNNGANDTRPKYEKPEFTPTPAAISINSFLFASLGASLLAALASVIALQWVADYDAAITRGGDTPLEQAKRRQFRFSGVERMMMAQIIDALPIIIFIGVVLFFIGLIQWMFEVNRTVGFIVVSAAVIAALFYCVSTLVAVVSAAAPFRTAPARWLYSFFRGLLRLMYRALQATRWKSASEWINKRYPTISDRTSRRDDRIIKTSPQLERDAYIWVSGQISISRVSYSRWMLLLNDLPRLTSLKLEPEESFVVPWKRLTAIAQHYLEISHITHHADDDSKIVSGLVIIARSQEILDKINPKESIAYEQDKSKAEYWNQYHSTVVTTPEAESRNPHPLFLLTRDLPTPSIRSSHEMEATIRLSKWRNSLDKDPEIWQDVLSHAGTYSATFLHDILQMLYSYIPHSRWGFGDKVKQKTYSSLFTTIFGQATRQDFPFDLSTSTVHAFGRLVCQEHSYQRPLQYGRSILSLPVHIKALHTSATLVLARSLRSCPQEQRPQRLKEVIAMLWLIPDDSLTYDIATHPRWDTFTDRSLTQLHNSLWFEDWPRRLKLLSHALEILECLVEAQRSCEGFGSLWRPEAEIDINIRISVFQIFDTLIASATTASQYFAAVETLCQGFEEEGTIGGQEPPISDEDLKILSGLSDPCARFIAHKVLGIVFPGPEMPIRKEFLEGTGDLLASSLSQERRAFVWELWVSVWIGFSPEQKEKWCRDARIHPDRILHLERMKNHPSMINLQYDAPFNLWRRLLEADLSAEWKGLKSLDMTEILNGRVLFDSVVLKSGHKVLGLVACLLYTRTTDPPPLKFPPDVCPEYIEYTWKMCEAIRAEPSLMSAQLVDLLAELAPKHWRRSECAIILKLLRDNINRRGGLPIEQLRSMSDALLGAAKSGRDRWVLWSDYVGEDMIRQANRSSDILLCEHYDRTTRPQRAISWPRNPGNHHPVGGWLPSRFLDSPSNPAVDLPVKLDNRQAESVHLTPDRLVHLWRRVSELARYALYANAWPRNLGRNHPVGNRLPVYV